MGIIVLLTNNETVMLPKRGKIREIETDREVNS